MPKDFKSIAEVFEQEPELSRIRTSVKQYDVVDSFSRLFPELAQIATAVKADKNILLLRVENSVWRSELRLNEKSIVEIINKYFKEERIKGVRFIS
jgi:uncharacterized FlgJ-related protein